MLPPLYERLHAYLALRQGQLKGSNPLFAITACYDRGGNVVTKDGEPYSIDGKRLSTRAIHRITRKG